MNTNNCLLENIRTQTCGRVLLTATRHLLIVIQPLCQDNGRQKDETVPMRQPFNTQLVQGQ